MRNVSKCNRRAQANVRNSNCYLADVGRSKLYIVGILTKVTMEVTTEEVKIIVG